jgi:C-terminal processing protease CtpA/Prc
VTKRRFHLWEKPVVYEAVSRRGCGAIEEGEQGIGYLRLTELDQDDGAKVRSWMEAFRSTRGVIIDCRGEQRWTAGGLQALASYLLPQDAPCVVVGAARERVRQQAEENVTARLGMREAADPRWSERQRAAIAALGGKFGARPGPDEVLGPMRYAVVDHHEWPRDAPVPFVYQGDVVILMDEQSTAGTEGFLRGVLEVRKCEDRKGLGTVTVIGRASGASERGTVRREIAPGWSVRVSSAVWYAADGGMIARPGVVPDEVVEVRLEDVLSGGKDRGIEQAVGKVRAQRGGWR